MTPSHESSGGGAPLTVRAANTSDGPFLAEVAASVRIDVYRPAGKGFLLFPMTADQYAARLDAGHRAWLLWRESRPVAMLAGAPSSALRAGRQGSPATYGPVYQFALDYFDEDRFFVLDQLAVVPAHQDAGYGHRLLSTVAEELRCPILIDVLDAQIQNPRLAWWQRQGFRRVGQVTERLPDDRRIDGSADVTWGLHVLEPAAR